MHLLVRGDHALDRDPEVQAAQQGADQGVGLLSQLGLAHFAVQRRLRQLQLHPAVRDLIGLFAQHAGDSFACGSLSGTQHFVLSVRPGPGDRRPARPRCRRAEPRSSTVAFRQMLSSAIKPGNPQAPSSPTEAGNGRKAESVRCFCVRRAEYQPPAEIPTAVPGFRDRGSTAPRLSGNAERSTLNRDRRRTSQNAAPRHHPASPPHGIRPHRAGPHPVPGRPAADAWRAAPVREAAATASPPPG